jgi:hypothetical protein
MGSTDSIKPMPAQEQITITKVLSTNFPMINNESSCCRRICPIQASSYSYFTTCLPTRFTETTTFSLWFSPIIARHIFGSLGTHQDDSKAVWHRLNLAAPDNQIPPSNKRKLASIPNDLDLLSFYKCLFKVSGDMAEGWNYF